MPSYSLPLSLGSLHRFAKHVVFQHIALFESIRSISPAIRSVAKSRIRSSSMRQRRPMIGSPCRPARPLSWRSTRLDSCRSVPMIASSSFSHFGVNLRRYPALPYWSRWLPPRVVLPCTISASRWCSLAFSTLCWIFLSVNIRLSNSEISTEVVPTSTGRPLPISSTISSITAVYFSRFCLVDPVVLVVLNNGSIGWDYHHVQLIDVPKLSSLPFRPYRSSRPACYTYGRSSGA